jgi:hypothetical protein
MLTNFVIATRSRFTPVRWCTHTRTHARKHRQCSGSVQWLSGSVLQAAWSLCVVYSTADTSHVCVRHCSTAEHTLSSRKGRGEAEYTRLEKSGMPEQDLSLCLCFSRAIVDVRRHLSNLGYRDLQLENILAHAVGCVLASLFQEHLVPVSSQYMTSR